MNLSILKELFSDVLDISEDDVVDTLAYGEHPKWDSVSHMALVAAIDKEYSIMLDTEDILDMSSFLKAKEILNKYK